jgi:hypothetical protein
MNTRNISFLLFLLCFIPFTTKAQKFEFHGDFLLFREAKNKQPVLIVNDSLVYKGNEMKRIAFKHTDYPAKLNEYIFFNIGTKTYLVHDGCGPILEYRNDSIVKINENYLQNNQYGNVHFVYNSEIYLFGGYGLFTTKNILTKYNFKTKDWLEVQTYGDKVQEPRAGAFSFIKGNDLYIFGGCAKDEIEISGVKKLDTKIWRLHLPTMKWKCEGNYNAKALKNDSEILGQNNRNLYFIGQNFIEIDLYKNKIYTNYRNYFPKPISSYIEGNTIVGVFGVGSKKFFYKGNINEFKGNIKQTSSFIIQIVETENGLYYFSLLLIIILILIYFYRKPIEKLIFPYNGIVFKNQKQIFKYKNKIIHFEDQEKIILFFLIDNLNQYISLNELNQLFEKANQPETISATVKRREQAVSGLLSKVSKITGIDESKLILERKNSEDKRIKDILLLPNLLKLVP